jgi:hypothetical protein
MSSIVPPAEYKKTAGYEIDGFWYPRVTKIVEIKAKPALYRFYGKMESFEAGERMKEKSALEGTLVHETVEGLLLGHDVVIPPSIAPSVTAFQAFIEKNHIHVDADFVERRLVNYDERYAGTLDAIAMIGGKVGILDIKTSQEIYRDYNLQTSAYFAAMRDVVKGLETRWILRIDQVQPCLRCGATLRTKGGAPKIRGTYGNPRSRGCTHEWGEAKGIIELKEFPAWEHDYHAFLGAKRLWEWENEEQLQAVGYL